jgi:nitrogen regulatory protein P-II 1
VIKSLREPSRWKKNSYPYAAPEFIPRIKMEVVVNDYQVDGIISKIANELANPAVGGKIFVVDVARAIDLATKERDEKAL